jgi:hypothetical protein
MNPHPEIAARRLLSGAVFLGAGTLAEQEVRLRALSEKPEVPARALAVVPWKRIAVKAVRIVAE